MKDVGGDTVHTFGAEASSGAGGTSVGVAGSFALNLVDNTSEAVIAGGSDQHRHRVTLCQCVPGRPCRLDLLTDCVA